MTGVQKDDPYNEFTEEVNIGTTCASVAVKLILDSRSGSTSPSQFGVVEFFTFAYI